MRKRHSKLRKVALFSFVIIAAVMVLNSLSGNMIGLSIFGAQKTGSTATIPSQIVIIQQGGGGGSSEGGSLARIGIYSDSGKTSNVVFIDWGLCYVGSSCTRIVYVVNTGNVNEVLSFATANFNPASASVLEFTTDYNGATLTPNQMVKVMFTLTVPTNAPAGSFTMDIVVTVTG